MLAVFGFTKIPEKPARKPKLQRTSPEDMASQRDSVETNQWKANQNQEAAERKESEVHVYITSLRMTCVDSFIFS